MDFYVGFKCGRVLFEGLKQAVREEQQHDPDVDMSKFIRDALATILMAREKAIKKEGVKSESRNTLL